jgi:GntR family transcriptional regulator
MEKLVRPMKLRKRVPLYIQIETLLKSKILTGALNEGDRLPSEMELSKQFGVSPLTVRQALSSLVAEGYLDRKPGRGTIIKRESEEKIVLRLSGKMDDLLSLGMKTETRVLKSGVIQGPDKAISSLRLNQGDPIFFVEKIRYWKGIPFMVVEEYVPEFLLETLPKNKNLLKSLFFILTQRKGIVLKEATQTIESSIADQRIASLLQIEMGLPLFYIERIFYNENGPPVFFQITHAHAEHFKFSVHLEYLQKEKEKKWAIY